MKLNILIHTHHFFLRPNNENANVVVSLPFSLHASNNHKLKEQKFYSSTVKSYIGDMTVLSKCDFGFRHLKLSEDGNALDRNLSRKIVHQELGYAAAYFDEFLTYLWFARDHSASSGLTLGFIEGKDDTLVAIQNIKTTTLSSGTTDDVYFTEENITTAVKIMNKIKEIYPSKSIKDIVTLTELDEEQNIKTITIKTFDDHTHYYKFNRIQRALSLLSILRTVSFLPYKLSLYIPVLESLFSPIDGKKLCDRVSKRAANYIGLDTVEIETICEQVRRTYKIRSKFLHGQPIENKSTLLDFKEESKKMDDILRRVLTKVILFDSQMFLSNDIEKKLSDLVSREN